VDIFLFPHTSSASAFGIVVWVQKRNIIAYGAGTTYNVEEIEIVVKISVLVQEGIQRR
jgi:hypothetical protein